VSGMNQVWLADITYIRIRSGFVYLSMIGLASLLLIASPIPSTPTTGDAYGGLVETVGEADVGSAVSVGVL